MYRAVGAYSTANYFIIQVIIFLYLLVYITQRCLIDFHLQQRKAADPLFFLEAGHFFFSSEK